MNSEMNQISVALTTTEYALVTDDGDNTFEIDMILKNIPVCVASMCLITPTKAPPDLVKSVCDIISTGIDKVKIDTEGQSIFIGEDPEKEDTALVLYRNFDKTLRTDAFFKRWNETGTFLFEYSVLNKNILGEDLGVAGCVRGVRLGDIWARLNLIDEPNLIIKENPLA